MRANEPIGGGPNDRIQATPDCASPFALAQSAGAPDPGHFPFSLRISFGFRASDFGFPGYGTVFTAGSLQGPVAFSAPMARTRTRVRPPVKPPSVALVGTRSSASPNSFPFSNEWDDVEVVPTSLGAFAVADR